MTRTKIRTRDHQSTSREAENTTRAIDHWATREIYWLHLHMVLWRWPQSSSNPVSFVALRCLLLPPVFSQQIPFLKWILYTGVGNGPRPVIYSAPPVRVDSARTPHGLCGVRVSPCGLCKIIASSGKHIYFYSIWDIWYMSWTSFSVWIQWECPFCDQTNHIW